MKDYLSEAWNWLAIWPALPIAELICPSIFNRFDTRKTSTTHHDCGVPPDAERVQDKAPSIVSLGLNEIPEPDNR